MLVLPGDSTLMASPKTNHLPKAHLQILIPSLCGPGLQHLNLGGKTIQSTETVFHGRVQKAHHLLRPVVTLGARASTSEFEGETIRSTETVFHGKVRRRHHFPRPVSMHITKDSVEALSAVWAGEAGIGLCLLRAMWMMM